MESTIVHNELALSFFGTPGAATDNQATQTVPGWNNLVTVNGSFFDNLDIAATTVPYTKSTVYDQVRWTNQFAQGIAAIILFNPVVNYGYIDTPSSATWAQYPYSSSRRMHPH